MMADLYFACPLCGPAVDPLGNGHGCCETCGAELIRLRVPEMDPQPPDGIATHWIEDEWSKL